MSAPDRPVRLSPDAERDYDDILLHSLLTWGDDQMRRYRDALDRALARLADFPEASAGRNHLFSGCRILPVESHVPYYRITDDRIEVVRILHERMDAARHL